MRSLCSALFLCAAVCSPDALAQQAVPSQPVPPKPDDPQASPSPTQARPIPGIRPQPGEGLVHVDPLALGDHSLRLLDGDPAFQRMLQMSLTDRGVSDGLILDDGNARHVAQRLSQRLPIAVFVVSSTQASVYSSLPVKLVSISRLRSDAASSATASSRESGTSALTCGSSPRCVSRA